MIEAAASDRRRPRPSTSRFRWNAPERSLDLLERPPGLARREAVPDQRDQVGADLRVVDEVAVAEQAGRRGHLDQGGDEAGARQLRGPLLREEGDVEAA